MKNNFKYTIYILLSIFSSFISCSEDEEIGGNGEGEATVANLKITPDGTLEYGDQILLTGELSDNLGLRSYTVTISNQKEDIYEFTQMLTGKKFNLKKELIIPLPLNAINSNLTVTLSVKNSNNIRHLESMTLSNVQVPSFERLYLVLDNNKTYPLEKEGDIYSTEDFIRAKAQGKIYKNADKTGLFWGMENDQLKALGNSNITFGKENESFFKISFNPTTISLDKGTSVNWTKTDDPLYILGTISGHWADEEIKEERQKMKMQCYTMGERKYWTWTPPSDGTGNAETDMWGNIIPGAFRFKKAGLNEFILFSGNKITNGPDDVNSSFVTTAGGAFTIKVFYDGTSYYKISLESETKTLDFTDESVYINGVAAANSITFGGQQLQLIEGSLYTYESTIPLNQTQSITAEGVDLRGAACDPDVFSGKGNSSWTVISTSGNYLVRIDPLAGSVYVCKQTGYPDVIYLDGWSWAKFDTDPAINWQPENRLSLYRNDASKFIYEGTMYIFDWGGDAAFYTAPASATTEQQHTITSKYFSGVGENAGNILIPTVAGYYKVTVDLKDGFTVNGANELVPNNGKKFTVTFSLII